ncbi:hypothetical protein MKW98_016796 [Papaver atlanticum]|uniref:Uncharacterized protein n=1 Tax=Papaver atlanticum TaxID=357466 RepID=A0AAD4TJR4_9MAGN|nr:hypothetical protein MKW98_016796 [Papaver atlanticum]
MYIYETSIHADKFNLAKPHLNIHNHQFIQWNVTMPRGRDPVKVYHDQRHRIHHETKISKVHILAKVGTSRS